MGNPFDFFSGGGSGGGGTPIDTQTAANGPSVLNRIFNPDKGGLLGAIGDLTGQHSNAERQGAVDANILQKLSGFYQGNGGNEQKAILSLLNDPVGHDLMSRPGASDTLERWHKSVQPTVQMLPAGNAPVSTKLGQTSVGAPNPPVETQNYNNNVPTYTNTPAETTTTGHQRGQPTSSVSGPPRIATTQPGAQTGGFDAQGNPVGKGVSTPTVPAQNFAYFSQFFRGTTEEQMSNLAKSQLPGADLALKTTTIQNMVANGQMSQEYADKVLSDQLVVMQGINEAGEPNHMFHIIDKSNGKAMQLTPSPVNAPGDQSLVVPSTAPGGKPAVFPPSAKLSDGTYDLKGVIAADPIDNMFLGAGIGNHLIAFAGQLVRSTVDPRNPEPANQLSAFRHDRIDQFQTAVAQLGSLHNNRLAQVVEKWTADTPSKFTDPKDAYNQAIGFRQRLETIMEQDKGYLDPQRGGGPARYATKFLQERREEIAAVQNVLSAMPTIPAMAQMINKIQVLPGTAMSLGGAATAAGGIVGGMVNDALGGEGGGAGTRSSRSRAQRPIVDNPAASAPAPVGKPSVEDIGKMDLKGLSGYIDTLPQGPSPERDAARERVKALTPKKQTAGRGNPPAPNASEPLEYGGGHPNPGPSVQDFTRNPMGTSDDDAGVADRFGLQGQEPATGGILDQIMNSYLQQRMKDKDSKGVMQRQRQQGQDILNSVPRRPAR